MGGGRPRKPTHLKELGNTLQPSRTNKAEPKTEVLLPVPPKWLSAKAKKYWAEIGAVLLDMKLTTAADGPALQLLTESLAEWAEARQIVHKAGLTYETTTMQGDTMYRPRPEVSIASDAMKRSLRMLIEFGLTPAARSKVSALGDEKGNDPLADIMNDLRG